MAGVFIKRLRANDMRKRSHKSRSSIVELIRAEYREVGFSIGKESLSEWLPSDTFSFHRIDADDIASPNLPHSPDDLKFYSSNRVEQFLRMHIVVDVNIHRVGCTPDMDFVPNVIVVAGTLAFRHAIMKGRHGISAYVGVLVYGELTL